MNKKFLKSLSVFTLVLVMAFSAVGCGDKDSSAAGDGGEKSKVQEPAKQLSEKEYKDKVEQIYTEITTKSTEMMGSIDQTKPEETIKGMTDMIKVVKPMYEELGALSAPDAFKDAQAKIKSGADASVEVLNLAVEMFNMQNGEIDPAEAAKKIEELQTKTAELTTKAQDLTTGLTMVIGQ